MARTKVKYPGSIYEPKDKGVPRGYLIVKIKVSKEGVRPIKYKRISTPYPNTPTGIKQAELIKKRYYEERMGIVPPLDPEFLQETIQNVFKKYIEHCKTKPARQEGKVGLHKKTIRNYENAFKAIVEKDFPFTVENIEKAVGSFLKKPHFIIPDHSRKKTKRGNRGGVFLSDDNTGTFNNVSINTYLNNFQIFLTWAADNKYIDHIDIKKKNLKNVEIEVDPFEKGEAQNLMQYFADTDWEYAVFLECGRLSGARPVDLLTLYEPQISWKKQEINWYNKITKRAEIQPVPQKMLDLLNTLPKRPDGKIFRWKYERDNDKYSGNSRIYKKFNRGLKACNIEKRNRSLQNIRQLFCNSVFELDELSLADQLLLTRHKTVDVTVRHYLKAQEKRIKNAISKLE